MIATDSLKVAGKIKTDKTFSLSELEAFPTVSITDITITNPKGEVKGIAKGLKGFLFKDLLNKIEILADTPKKLNEFYFVLIASDGYKVVFSWNELFNTQTGNTTFIVTESEGKKLNEMNDRILVVSTKDFITGRRYIKGLEKINVEQIK